jgi:5-formyltetrahydrofolate cyclo-ligase
LVADKKSIRKDILKQRALLSQEDVMQRSLAMEAHLAHWLINRSFTSIFLYAPIRNEPVLTGLITSQKSLIFALPVVVGPSEMVFYQVNDSTSYAVNRWGIPEPIEKDRRKVCSIDDKTLIVVPAVAADRNGIRLGYGAGFYDRYLENSNSTQVIAVFSEFILAAIPREKHDIKADFVLTENGMGEC